MADEEKGLAVLGYAWFTTTCLALLRVSSRNPFCSSPTGCPFTWFFGGVATLFYEDTSCVCESQQRETWNHNNTRDLGLGLAYLLLLL